MTPAALMSARAGKLESIAEKRSVPEALRPREARQSSNLRGIAAVTCAIG